MARTILMYTNTGVGRNLNKVERNFESAYRKFVLNIGHKYWARLTVVDDIVYQIVDYSYEKFNTTT